MKILLFGAPNVGKTTTGKLLADHLGYAFYDLDDQIKAQFHTTLEKFTHNTDLRWRDHARGIIIKRILAQNENLVLAVSPISFTDTFQSALSADDVLSIELYDSAEHIFSRLVFSDENDQAYTDDAYKNRYRKYYLKAIQDDLDWYGRIYRAAGIINRLFMNNASSGEVVHKIIAEYMPSAVE